MKLIEFKPPKDVAVPEGLASGETFSEMATFRLKPNGDLCLVAIGDAQLPGYDKKEAMHDDGMGESKSRAMSRYHEKMEGGSDAGNGDVSDY